MDLLRVTYMELRQPPSPMAPSPGPERIALEALRSAPYLALYRRVGGPLRWDQRTRMPEAELEALLRSGHVEIYVARSLTGEALGFCEFEISGFPVVELKNFGLVPEAQGRGLGPRLLSTALLDQWRRRPTRIWLHTDTWDHPAAVRVYERVGFRVYEVREEPAGSL